MHLLSHKDVRLCVVTVGHISFHTQGEEIAAWPADPAFFQKVATLANPGRSGNRKAPESSRLTEVVKLRPWCSPARSWVMAFSDLCNNQAVGFGTEGAFPGGGGSRQTFLSSVNCGPHQTLSLRANPGKPHQAVRDILENSPFFSVRQQITLHRSDLLSHNVTNGVLQAYLI